MQARGLLEAALYTSELPALERFYVEVLGLECIARTEGRNAVLRCGTSAVILFQREASLQEGGLFPPHGATGAGHLAFVVEAGDLEAWRSHLQGWGIAVEREVRWPEGGVSLYFRDPAGNSLELAPPTLWQGLGSRLLASMDA
jgi:catechol-2,3-dioxygenase